MSKTATPNKPIYVLIGTKAQYIKTAPLMRLMQKKGVEYILIDSGQHAEFTKHLRKELKVKDPDVVLADSGNIKSVLVAALWFAKYTLIFLFGRRYLEREVFANGRGVCILHGDTPSTLLGLMLAMRTRQKIVHIEAGLRSYNIWKPFPEELVRVICMRYSHLLFAPSDWALENIRKMKVKGRALNLEQNTNVEAMYYSLDTGDIEKRQQPFALMTIHRVETILSRERLTKVIELAERIAKDTKVVFVQHDPTVVKLKQFDLEKRLLENPNIETTGLLDHVRFLGLIDQAEFVVTDGGSIQEESHYLDVPCLVMRTETERQEGLGTNVVISEFDPEKVSHFLQHYRELRCGQRIENIHPSETILREINEEMLKVS